MIKKCVDSEVVSWQVCCQLVFDQGQAIICVHRGQLLVVRHIIMTGVTLVNYCRDWNPSPFGSIARKKNTPTSTGIWHPSNPFLRLFLCANKKSIPLTRASHYPSTRSSNEPTPFAHFLPPSDPTLQVGFSLCHNHVRILRSSYFFCFTFHVVCCLSQESCRAWSRWRHWPTLVPFAQVVSLGRWIDVLRYSRNSWCRCRFESCKWMNEQTK